MVRPIASAIGRTRGSRRLGLALQDTPAQIHKYYQTYFSHKPPKLWGDLKPRHPAAR